MKYLARSILIIVIVAVATLAFAYWMKGKLDTDAKIIDLRIDAGSEQMDLRWKQQKDVDHYVLLKKELDADSDEEMIVESRDSYTELCTISGDTFFYRDKEVERGHRYSYIIDGYSKKHGSMKVAYTSYQGGAVEYNTVGLARPVLLNGGYGEFYTNSKDEIYLYVECYEGIEPEGAVLYRKSSRENKFSKISYKLPEADSVSMLLDDTVTPGETYTYRIKTFADDDGEKYYSTYSKEITIPAVNFTAEYAVESVTAAKAGKSGDFFVIKLTSDKYNGVTIFDCVPSMIYHVRKDGSEETQTFEAELTGYSKGNPSDPTQWDGIPARGVELNGGESLYLKYELSDPDGGKVFFGGDTAEESYLRTDEENADAAIYEGPGRGTTYMKLDLKNGTGEAWCNWD